MFSCLDLLEPQFFHAVVMPLPSMNITMDLQETIAFTFRIPPTVIYQFDIRVLYWSLSSRPKPLLNQLRDGKWRRGAFGWGGGGLLEPWRHMISCSV
jgi:hypothetical protein